MPTLEISLFGGLNVQRAGVPVTGFESVRTRALFAYLVVHADRSHDRDALAVLLWPERSGDVARRNLRQALSNLQRVLQNQTANPPFILADRTTIQFNRASDARADVWQFGLITDRLLSGGYNSAGESERALRDLELAAGLYHGEFLAHFFVDDSPEFEEWLLLRREYFHRRVISALRQITAYYEQAGAAHFSIAERYARRHIELEAWSEEPYRVLMRIYAAQNEIDRALAVYHTLTNALHQELGLEPSAETTALYKHLRHTRQTQTESLAVNIAELDIPTTNFYLPIPPTPLVGREWELGELAKITLSDCRVMTLVGPGGIGKTRLALETARTYRAAFPRGACFIDLADITLPEVLPHTIAEAMHLPLRGSGSAAAQLIEHLQAFDQPLLLILDNFEQLLVRQENPTQFLSQLLRTAVHVKLLVTSRERLNLVGEWLFPVDGLRAPAIGTALTKSEWDASEAVQLFVQCAARLNVNPDVWNQEEQRAVMRITQLVEGMPLAIELASAWLRTLAPVEIAEEITRSLDILAGTQRDLPARHASIRAVFEHSWILLMPTEQDAFARLSVFHGGFTREAAREIAGASLQTVSALVEKSLVKRTAAGRFRLHELVRQFAAEKLQARDETVRMQKQHANYFLDLVVQRGRELNGSQAREALAELQRDGENVRAAWHAAVLWSETDRLARTVADLIAFYQAAGLVQEGLVLLRETLDARDRSAGFCIAPDSALASEIYAYLANFYLSTAAYPQTMMMAEHALDIGRATGNVTAQVMGEWLLGTALYRHTRASAAAAHLENARQLAHTAHLPALEAECLYILAEREHTLLNKENAHQLFSRALELAEQQGQLRLAAKILTGMAALANHESDLAQAEALLLRVLPLRRMLGDPGGELNSYIHLGTLAVFRCEFDKARVWHSQAVMLAREIGEQRAWIHSLVNQAWGMMLSGAYQTARPIYQEALARARDRGDVWAVCNALWGLSAIENALGQPARALAHARAHLEFAIEVQEKREITFAQLMLAHAHEAQGDFAEAENLYRQAMTELNQRNLRGDALMCLAGLARVALARGELPEAQVLASELLDALAAKLPQVDAEPLRQYLACYQVLAACGDPRAAKVLDDAYVLLQAQAAATRDPVVRNAFLENVPWHRELVQAWKATG